MIYDSWRPQQAQLTPLDAWASYCPLNECSPPLSLPGNPGDASVLPLFGSASSLVPGGTAAAAGTLPANDAKDVLMHAGGSVWALDWCPAALPALSTDEAAAPPASSTSAAEPATAQYLAVGCHPAGSPLHRIGAAVQGPNVIQIWEVHGLAGRSSLDRVPPPRMALAVAHMGGLTWHCRWCPAAELADGPGDRPAEGSLHRLGLLAAALGDGTAQVWAVPQPRAVRRPEASAAAQPLVVLPFPVAAVSSAQLGGSMPALVDWLPSPPHDLLLIGCWDGSVAILKMTPGGEEGLGQEQYRAAAAAAATAAAAVAAAAAAAAGDGAAGVSPIAAAAEAARVRAEAEAAARLAPPPPPQPLGMYLVAHFPGDTLPLRAAKWLPPLSPSIDLAHRHTFLTAGHEGSIKIWDARDQFQPAYCQQLTTSTVLDAAWTASPLGVMAAAEDGSLRGVLLASSALGQQLGGAGKPVFSAMWRGASAGALWAVDAHPVAQVVAYAGEDGVVGMARADYHWDHRKRRPHLPLGAVKADGAGGLRVLCQEALEADNGGLFVDRVVERPAALAAAAGDVPDAVQAVQRLAWEPRLSGGGAAWLAMGGAGGVVRCQWVTLRDL